MELAGQNLSNDKTVRSDTVRDLKGFNSHTSQKRKTTCFHDACN